MNSKNQDHENRGFNVVKKLVLRDLLETPNTTARISERLAEEPHNISNVLRRLLRARLVTREKSARVLTQDRRWRRLYVYEITQNGKKRLEMYKAQALANLKP